MFQWYVVRKTCDIGRYINWNFISSLTLLSKYIITSKLQLWSVWQKWTIFKVLCVNFFTNVVQIFGDPFGFFKNITFKVKASLATFGKFGLLFIPNSGHTDRRRNTKWTSDSISYNVVPSAHHSIGGLGTNLIFFENIYRNFFQLLTDDLCQVFILEDHDDWHQDEEDDGREEVLDNVWWIAP